MSDIVVGLDIGTHKICTVVGEVRPDDIQILGVGIEPSKGMKKGVVNDVQALVAAISASVHKAEKNERLSDPARLCQRRWWPYFLADQSRYDGYRRDTRHQ